MLDICDFLGFRFSRSCHPIKREGNKPAFDISSLDKCLGKCQSNCACLQRNPQLVFGTLQFLLIQLQRRVRLRDPDLGIMRLHTLQEHFHEIFWTLKRYEEIMLILMILLFFAKSVWMLKDTRQPHMAECTGFCPMLGSYEKLGISFWSQRWRQCRADLKRLAVNDSLTPLRSTHCSIDPID